MGVAVRIGCARASAPCRAGASPRRFPPALIRAGRHGAGAGHARVPAARLPPVLASASSCGGCVSPAVSLLYESVILRARPPHGYMETHRRQMRPVTTGGTRRITWHSPGDGRPPEHPGAPSRVARRQSARWHPARDDGIGRRREHGRTRRARRRRERAVPRRAPHGMEAAPARRPCGRGSGDSATRPGSNTIMRRSR